MSTPKLSTCVVLAITSETALLAIDGIPNLTRTHEFLRHFFSPQPVIIATTPALALKVRDLIDKSGKHDELLICQTTEPISFAKSLDDFILNYDVVVIHDASRPLTTRGQFERVLAAMGNDIDAVRPAMAFTETLKILSADSIILETLDRTSVLRISTPEFIRVSAIDMNSTDSGWFLPLKNDAHVLHVEGEPEGLRINTVDDRDLMELH
jgi:2-C-methyl-D-erythritol 4-phosphate cytidylyltransferase